MDPALLREIEQIAAASGCSLEHAELKGGTLRLILDKPGGVNLGDCEHVSKQVSAFLDVLDFGRSRYVLEVSSPGLDRQLYRPHDYERFAGHLARVTIEEPAEDGAPKKKTVVARLQGLRWTEGASPAEDAGAEDAGAEDAGDAEVLLFDDASGKSWTVPLKNIRMARLEIEL
jgi:ribosome maturation factor RimP